jgi:GR25 family glycosyltransferase involved in LPS biosynthesis
MEKIGKIVYINLDKRVRKKNYMERMLPRLNIPFERFPAIQPSDLSLVGQDGEYRSFFEKASTRVSGYIDGPKKNPSRGRGVFGCYLSHYKVLEDNLDNASMLLILEDDAIVRPEDIAFVEGYISNRLPDKDWDIIRSLKREHTRKKIKFKNRLYKFNCPNRQSVFASKGKRKNRIHGGTHFCLINKSKTRKILQYLKEERTYNMDSIYSTNRINSYVLSFPGRDLSHKKWKKRSDIPK